MTAAELLAHELAPVALDDGERRLLAALAAGETPLSHAAEIRLAQMTEQIRTYVARQAATGEGAAENLTEQGNARRLVRRHGRRIRYVHAWEKWVLFDGARWARDETAEIERLAKETVVSLCAEAQLVETAEERQALLKWARQSERAAHICRAMLELAASEPGVPVTPEQLDADPWALNVVNGTLDLRSATLNPHDPADLITRLVPVSYEPSATCPRFDRFLEEILGGRADLIAYLQRAVGYALTGVTTEQVLLFLHGTGANGKTTLVQVLLALLGDYATQTPFTTFLEQRAEGGRSDLARLAGARLVAASEVGDGMRLDEGLVKSLTGGDTIVARFMYREWFTFRPAFKLLLVANHKPVIRGTDAAIWRRIHLVPFTVAIPEPDRDPHLPEKLTAELPGVLRWAVEGCLAWQREGLNPPAIVRSATLRYREEMDTIGAFLDDRCRLSAEGRTSAKALYTAYQTWAQDAGERALSQRRLGERLAERGLRSVKASVVYWLGLEMLAPAVACNERKGGSDASWGKSPHARAGEDFTQTGSEPSLGPMFGQPNRPPEPPEAA